MLTNNEIERLKQAIIATVASPVIGSIEDYAWEAIFHYVKDIPSEVLNVKKSVIKIAQNILKFEQAISKY